MYVEKPAVRFVLEDFLRIIVDKIDLSVSKVTPFLGKSKFAEEVRDLIKTVSKNTASVLLIGERGTGKRLFAENVHALYSNILKDFFVINCRISESETDKVISRIISSVKQDSKNIKTLFIESLDCCSIDLQQKILSLLKFIRSESVKVKIISSSEKNLESSLNDGTLITELYCYLNSVTLNFIPLRSRVEDIPVLAEYYFQYFTKKSGLTFNGYSQQAIDGMNENYWIGNIDELINAVQRAFIIGRNDVINLSDLGINTEVNVASQVAGESFSDKSLKNAIDSFKREYITKILEENGWNQTKTAAILGIQRTYVIRLINELEIRDKRK